MNPFRKLGENLRELRIKAQESIEEVAGAVEIDVARLEMIEAGSLRPSEDIVELLIFHFKLDEKEAVELWSEAGYARPVSGDDEEPNKNIVNLSVPADSRILYTDMVHVMSNQFGVILNFVQSVGPGAQPMVVSRVGMSKEHAKSVIEVLKQALEPSDAQSNNTPKQLPAPDQAESKTDKKSS